MVGKVRVQKRLYYKIGEACKALGIQPYVLRYWETEFPALAPSKSRSGQRVYSEKELEIIRRIKELLYEEGYTIAGAKKKLETELASGSLDDRGEEQPEAAVPPEAPLPVETTVEEPLAPPPPRPPARRARPQPVDVVSVAPEATPEAVPEPREPAAAFDGEATERIQRLRLGIAKALQEAHDLLALLDSKTAAGGTDRL
jgi:DNA-binding transcriptional MerR regulator